MVRGGFPSDFPYLHTAKQLSAVCLSVPPNMYDDSVCRAGGIDGWARVVAACGCAQISRDAMYARCDDDEK